MNYKKFIAGFYFIGFSPFSLAGTYIPVCPNEINTTEQIKTVPKGWEALNGTMRHYFNGVSLYSDHPNKMASLKPEFINKKKAKWVFSPQEIIYLTCHYNQSGIELTQALAPKTTRCFVTFNQNLMGDRGYIPEKIECRN